jgi:uncharacterized protein with FMN-binding domain
MEAREKPKGKRKGKRKMVGWIIAIVIVVAVAFGVGAMFCAPWSPLKKEHEEAANVPIAAVDFSGLQDGTYTGEYAGGMYKWRENKVQVTVSSGKVTDIKVLEDANKKETVPERDATYAKVLEAQSLQVDVVSGATLTCKAYLKGIEDAVLKAEK